MNIPVGTNGFLFFNIIGLTSLMDRVTSIALSVKFCAFLPTLFDEKCCVSEVLKPLDASLELEVDINL